MLKLQAKETSNKKEGTPQGTLRTSRREKAPRLGQRQEPVLLIHE